MNREIKRLKLRQEIAECRKEIAEKELKIMDLEDEELFEQYSMEFEDVKTLESTPTKMGNIIELPNGIQLAASACKDYTSVKYLGGGVIRTGLINCKLSAPQIIMLEQEYNDGTIPKKGIDTRKKWASKIAGFPIRIDTILWNLYRGKLTDALNEYRNETPLIFGNEGQII
jgi:hypothetical protein